MCRERFARETTGVQFAKIREFQPAVGHPGVNPFHRRAHRVNSLSLEQRGFNVVGVVIFVAKFAQDICFDNAGIEMDVVAANQPGLLCKRNESVNDEHERFAVFHRVFRGNAVDGHGIVRYFPTGRPDNVGFLYVAEHPRNLHDVRVTFKVHVPFGGAVRNTCCFGIEK